MFVGELRDDDDIAASQDTADKRPAFLGLTLVVHEKGDTKTKAQLEELIKANGGSVADSVTKAALCVVSYTGIVDDDEPAVTAAKEHFLPGVGEAFVLTASRLASCKT